MQYQFNISNIFISNVKGRRKTKNNNGIIFYTTSIHVIDKICSFVEIIA